MGSTGAGAEPAFLSVSGEHYQAATPPPVGQLQLAETPPALRENKTYYYGVVVRPNRPMQKSDFLRKIQANIATYGYHVTVVTGGALPRYAYTIGGKDLVGAEFVFAGGEAYSQAQVGQILQAFLSRASQVPAWQQATLAVGLVGHFSLVQAEASWCHRLLLGAFYYGNNIRVYTKWNCLRSYTDL